MKEVPGQKECNEFEVSWISHTLLDPAGLYSKERNMFEGICITSRSIFNAPRPALASTSEQ